MRLRKRRRAEEDVAFVVRLKALPEMQEKEALEEEHSSSLFMFVKKSESGKNPQDFLLGEIFGKCQNEKLNVKCTLLHVEIYKLFHTEINLQFDLIIFYQGVKI
jgi:hypothetical protein